MPITHKPAGTSQGGQFAATARSESSIEVTTKPPIDRSFAPSDAAVVARRAVSELDRVDNDRALIALAQEIRHDHPDAEYFSITADYEDGYPIKNVYVHDSDGRSERYYAPGARDGSDDALAHLYDQELVSQVPMAEHEQPWDERFEVGDGAATVGAWRIEDVANAEISEAHAREARAAARRQLREALAQLDAED